MPDIPGPTAEPTVQGTPWSLGVRCDTPGCDTRFEGDFLVAEDSTRPERLRVVLDYAESHGWRVVPVPPGLGPLTYCPPCSRDIPEVPDGR
jgi:hypothetical protein